LTRNNQHFHFTDKYIFIKKLISWLHRHDHFSFFNSNNYQFPYEPFLTFAAAGAVNIFNSIKKDPFDELKEFYQYNNDWLIGRFNYDLKNFIEKLTSKHIDRLQFSDIYFFVPETLIFIHSDHIEIQTIHIPTEVFDSINQTNINHGMIDLEPILCDTSKDVYIANVNKIKQQIVEGDFYELNYCIEFYSNQALIFPPDIYYKLNSISPMPFSVFQGLENQYIISASPERFLKKSGKDLIAQPIKGTIRRDPDRKLDELLKMELQNSEKEIAENMMIVDLTRNDLGKSAIAGSVKVPEIFKIYSFSHVHQMISTITCELNNDVHPVDAIKHAFPMGSMTGTPKIRVMQEIEKYESSKRGSFSGAAGYFSPDGNFDFNVLIRSIFYNSKLQSLKFNVGSAITFDANPGYEYKECLLKAAAIQEVLQANRNLI